MKKALSPEVFIKADDALYLSDVSFMETLGYAFSDENEKEAIETLLSVLFRLPIDEEVVLKVISIRQTRKMKLPDAIIAATALIHDCMVITRNISDFSGLPGLVVLNPKVFP